MEKAIEGKKRVNSIDICKAVGIFLIVLGHVLKSGDLRKFIYSFHVPLFFFLSGLCFTSKKNKEFIIKKIKTIYLPYIIVSIISIVIYSFLGKYIAGSLETSILDNILGMLYANSNLNNMQWNQPLWFLPCLMMQLIIINVIENLISGLDKKFFIRILITVGVTIIGVRFSYCKIFLPLQLETAMSMMIFTYIGVMIKRYDIIEKITLNLELRKKILLFVFMIIAVSVLSYVSINNNITISVADDKYGNYCIFLLVAYFMVLCTYLLSLFIERVPKINDYCIYIGRNTLIVLLLHKFPILFFQEICPGICSNLNKSDTLWNNLVASILAVIVIELCIIVQFILKKINRRDIE